MTVKQCIGKQYEIVVRRRSEMGGQERYNERRKRR
jgi:hypothetical protein